MKNLFSFAFFIGSARPPFEWIYQFHGGLAHNEESNKSLLGANRCLNHG